MVVANDTMANLHDHRAEATDQVSIQHGWAGVVGEIIEDYGNIGWKGRRLYTVRWKTDDEPELAAGDDDLELVSD